MPEKDEFEYIQATKALLNSSLLTAVKSTKGISLVSEKQDVAGTQP